MLDVEKMKARHDMLRDLWNNGLTYSQIGAKMGISRNAAIGIGNRLKLRRGPRPPNVTTMKNKTPNRRIRPRRSMVLEIVENRTPGKKTIYELTPGDCRYPCEEIAESRFMFCGAARTHGSSYCAEHREKCVVKILLRGGP